MSIAFSPASGYNLHIVGWSQMLWNTDRRQCYVTRVVAYVPDTFISSRHVTPQIAAGAWILRVEDRMIHK
jgi:hypothetical protein